MENYKELLNLAAEKFMVAQEQFDMERYHTAAHLFINAAINYHNAVCQKFLKKIQSHRNHSDTSYFRELATYLGDDYQKYKDSYSKIIPYKGESDYGVGISMNSAELIKRHAGKIKEIAERLL